MRKIILTITWFEVSWPQEAPKKMTVTWGNFNYVFCAFVCYIINLYGRSPSEIVGSNPTGGMDVCLLWVLCVVR